MHLPTSWMLHCEIFSCACTYTWCCVVRSSLALGDRLDATLGDLLLLLWMHFPTSWLLHCEIFSCTCRHAWSYVRRSSLALARKRVGCYVVRSALALAHTLDATLWDLLLHLQTDLMLQLILLPCPRIQQWILRHSLAKWQLSDNMKKGTYSA